MNTGKEAKKSPCLEIYYCKYRKNSELIELIYFHELNSYRIRYLLMSALNIRTFQIRKKMINRALLTMHLVSFLFIRRKK